MCELFFVVFFCLFALFCLHFFFFLSREYFFKDTIEICRFITVKNVNEPIFNNCHRLNCDVYLGNVLGSVLMCIFNVD